MNGFTKQEQGFLLFLTVSFLVGTVVWLYRDRWIPLPALDESLKRDRVTFIGDSLSQASESAAREPISINRATIDELQALPGIGPVMAGRILEYRLENGGFKRIEDLLEVKGIGSKTFEKLKNRIRL